MRAALIREFGDPDVIKVANLAPPSIEGTPVVQVTASPVIDLDTKLRAVEIPEFGLNPPYVPGGAVVGNLSTPANTGLPEGTRVAARTVANAQGGAAEFAAVLADTIVQVPPELDDATAASLLLDGVTAVVLLRSLNPALQDRVLILGAAGGAARLLAQFASASGSHVIGTARGPEKAADVLASTGRAAVDHSDPDWTARARTALEGPATLVFDGIGGDLGRTALHQLTAPGTRFSAHGAASGEFSVLPDDETIPDGVIVSGIEVPQRALLDYRTTLREAFRRAVVGTFRPRVGRVGGLDELAAMHRAIEERTQVGATILTP